MEIQGRTFLVTGGASGLGAATMRRLAQEGANVLITDVDEDAGEELAAGIGEQARFARADVTDEESTQKALDTARDAFDGQIGQVAYSASKGGVASITLPLARELAAHGNRVGVRLFLADAEANHSY
ncbi:MAG: hypothetical protein QOI57_2475 [Rubrobacteraceae bacterium]|jgi:NAD(P)-dependent dehydrogenase (short-subunit alcohol dehydrogenase family)|nr:hypothetical protein [Rubrobacteraceae bacterium]